LNLVLNPEPDIMSFAVTIAYDATGDSFTANGIAVNFTNGGVSTLLMGGVFDLNATIDQTGVASSGSLTISDDSSTLLTGVLSAFGFDDMAASEPDPFEFLFDTTGGVLSAVFGPQIAVILVSTAALPTNSVGGTVFENDFEVAAAGIADAGTPVPEPGSMLTLALGLSMLALSRRKRSRPATA
jgi:hypothetical protein